MVGKQSEDGGPSKAGNSPWHILLGVFKPAAGQNEIGVTNQGWSARLRAACDGQTLRETLVVFLALVALGIAPGLAVHAPAGMLTYGTIALLSSIVVFLAMWLVDRRLQLSWADRGKAALAFGAVCWLGTASIPLLPYVGLSSYEAEYIGQMELSLLLGCVAATAALWRQFRGRTIPVALLLIVILLSYRYALFHLSSGALSFIIVPLPVVLVSWLLATPKWRVSALLDVVIIATVWLIPFATLLLLSALSTLITLASILPGLSPIYVLAMALPTALAWPAIRLARPGFTWPSASGAMVFDGPLKTGAAVLAGLYAVAFIWTSAERNAPLSKCLTSVEACSAVIDSIQASAGDRIKALESRASSYESDSKWDQAIADRSKLIELDPKNPERYTARAHLWRQIESYDQAIGDLDAAVALQPTNSSLYSIRSDLWTNKGDDARALADLDQVVRLEPSAENFVKRAKYNLEQTRLTAAISDYSTAIKMDPKNVSYLEARAEALAKKGDAASAQADYMSIIRLYDASIASTPTVDAFLSRADIWKQLKNHQKAMADYTSAIRLDPSYGFNFDRRYWLVQSMTDDPVRIMKQLDEFVSKEPFADNYRIRAEARDDSEIDKSLADYDQAIRLKPDTIDFRFARAALLEKKGNLAAAIADYDRAIQANPKDAKALYRRGMAKSNKGDRTSAADLAAARAIDPEIDK
ncbi:tetratricopeptide repeat protein [Bradyrhizobium sp. 199]|uniref:tetratricopeptide repeat protein n=1 Tax=Bradyrhizobium sp. 199 TaxID=2782664 RepID=UPI003211B499